MDIVMQDANGVEIRVGDVVLVGDERARVVEITEIDGDVNDHGLPVRLGPDVIVEFEDGSDDSYHGHWRAVWHDDYDAPFRCEDVVLPPEVAAERTPRVELNGVVLSGAARERLDRTLFRLKAKSASLYETSAGVRAFVVDRGGGEHHGVAVTSRVVAEAFNEARERGML